MTKILIQTIVLVTCMAAGWISLSTKLDTNSEAGSKVSGKLKEQVEAYREEASQAQSTLLTHVDTTQGFVTTAISQNSALAEQNQKLLASIDSLTQQVLHLTEQNTKMAEQNTNLLAEIKGVNDAQTEILKEHTQTLKEAKQAAKRSSDAAENVQANIKKTLRAVTKPTPKPWWQFR